MFHGWALAHGVDPMELEAAAFLDLLHYYRVRSAEDPEQASQLLTGALAEEEKPAMVTEAAQKMPVPSWWKGGTTASEAQMIVEQARRARTG